VATSAVCDPVGLTAGYKRHKRRKEGGDGGFPSVRHGCTDATPPRRRAAAIPSQPLAGLGSGMGMGVTPSSHPPSLQRRGSLRGRVALVTGCAMGIGREVCVALAQCGAHVVGWDVDLEGMRELKEASRSGSADSASIQIDCFACDVSCKSEIEKAARELTVLGLAPDILVNNAGVVSGRFFLDCSDAEIEKTFAVNTMAHVWTIR